MLGSKDDSDSFFHQCLPRSRLVIFRRDNDDLLTATIISGDAGQEAKYRSEFTVEATHGYAFDTKFGVITWFSQNDSSHFKLTLYTPEFEITAKKVTTTKKDEPIHFEFENGDGEHKYHLSATITIEK